MVYTYTMKDYFLETERLVLRKMSSEDFNEVSEMLQDKKVMYAWEHNFSDKDVKNWINKNISLYKQHNMGYFLAVDKVTKNVVGQAAIMPDTIKGESHIEIGYILKHKFWKKGYAIECAKALSEYAFKILKKSHIIFEIRPENISSRKIAEKMGAKINGSFIKRVRGKDMEHLIYNLPNSL